MTTNLFLLAWQFPQVLAKLIRSPIVLIGDCSFRTPHQLQMQFLIWVANGHSTRAWSAHSGLPMHKLHNNELTTIPLRSKAIADGIWFCTALHIKHNTLIRTTLFQAITGATGILTFVLSICCLIELTEYMPSDEILHLQWSSPISNWIPDTLFCFLCLFCITLGSP